MDAAGFFYDPLPHYNVVSQSGKRCLLVKLITVRVGNRCAFTFFKITLDKRTRASGGISGDKLRDAGTRGSANQLDLTRQERRRGMKSFILTVRRNWISSSPSPPSAIVNRGLEELHGELCRRRRQVERYSPVSGRLKGELIGQPAYPKGGAGQVHGGTLSRARRALYCTPIVLHGTGPPLFSPRFRSGACT